MIDTTPIIGTTMRRTMKDSGAFAVPVGEATVITGVVFVTFNGSGVAAVVTSVGCVVVRFPFRRSDARPIARVLFAWTALSPGFAASAWS